MINEQMSHPKHNLVGRRFGRLVVVKFAGSRRSGAAKTAKRFWSCRCDCGQDVDVRTDALVRDVARSCGCLQRDTAAKIARQQTSQETLNLRAVRARREAKGLPSNLNIRDLTGRRFGRLKVVAFAEVRDQQSFWGCLCDCGENTIVSAARLNYGWTKSCGCLQREAPERSKKNLKHGQYRTPEYRAWNQMKNRCLNPNVERYKSYGGRGIKVCERWIDSFETFFVYVGRRPSPKHSLDRINNDGNYEPGNVRWATRAQQYASRRSGGKK